MSGKRPKPPEDIYFPVVPMLDMSFQLLAFFILTFQAPGLETRIDLELPVGPVVLPARTAVSPRAATAPADDLENELRVDATAAEDGSLARLTLEGSAVADAEELATRLKRYRELLAGEELRVILVASDDLRYEEAARILGACTRAGVAGMRLAPPASGSPR